MDCRWHIGFVCTGTARACWRGVRGAGAAKTNCATLRSHGCCRSLFGLECMRRRLVDSSNPETHRIEQSGRGCGVSRCGFEVLYQTDTGCGCGLDVCLARSATWRERERESFFSAAFFLQKCESQHHETAIVARGAGPGDPRQSAPLTWCTLFSSGLMPQVTRRIWVISGKQSGRGRGSCASSGGLDNSVRDVRSRPVVDAVRMLRDWFRPRATRRSTCTCSVTARPNVKLLRAVKPRTWRQSATLRAPEICFWTSASRLVCASVPAGAGPLQSLMPRALETSV